MFLYIDPIKQGLKHKDKNVIDYIDKKFLYIDPIKQGLKQIEYSITGLLLSSFYT